MYRLFMSLHWLTQFFQNTNAAAISIAVLVVIADISFLRKILRGDPNIFNRKQAVKLCRTLQFLSLQKTRIVLT